METFIAGLIDGLVGCQSQQQIYACDNWQNWKLNFSLILTEIPSLEKRKKKMTYWEGFGNFIASVNKVTRSQESTSNVKKLKLGKRRKTNKEVWVMTMQMVTYLVTQPLIPGLCATDVGNWVTSGQAVLRCYRRSNSPHRTGMLHPLQVPNL